VIVIAVLAVPALLAMAPWRIGGGPTGFPIWVLVLATIAVVYCVSSVR